MIDEKILSYKDVRNAPNEDFGKLAVEQEIKRQQLENRNQKLLNDNARLERVNSNIEQERAQIRYEKTELTKEKQKLKSEKEDFKYEKAIFARTKAKLANENDDDNKKHIVIIRGGPGTGKSVLAINLLAKCISKLGLNATYITKNMAPRKCYSKLLARGNAKKEVKAAEKEVKTAEKAVKAAEKEVTKAKKNYTLENEYAHKSLTEAKREVTRYYIRPQNIFCSNKADVLKALIELDDQNCSVYTLKNLKDNKDVHKLTTNDIIYHGNYPQSRVTDTTIISKLNTTASYYPEPKNPRKWTIFSWYSNSSTSTEYAWYQDVDYQNVKYRGIYFTKYRPKTVKETASDTDTTCYQYKNGYIKGNVYWFKYEPIAWRILENNNGDYFVMSNKILDVVQYSNDVTSKVRQDYNNVSSGSNTAASIYLYSDLRTYLNRNFLSKAFTTDEKARILTTVVDNSSTSGPSSSSPYFTSSCNDKIFALSYNELGTKYGFKSQSYADPSRALFPTEYAKCVGINVGSDGKASYWTRTPCDTYSLAYSISYTGMPQGKYGYDVLSQACGIIPAMHIK